MSTPENKNTSPTPSEMNLNDVDLLNADDEYDSEAAFIARVEAAYANLKTEQHTLTEMYQAGKYEELNEEIDSLAENIAMKNPEFLENIAEIRKLQTYRNPDKSAIKEMVARQKELLATYRSWIIMEAGLPDEVRFSEIEKAKNNIGDLLANQYPDGNFSPNDALLTLGIVSVDENDRKTYRFPEEIVPESTNELWKTYLAAVCNHVKTQRDLSSHVIDDKAAVEQADKTRTYAHNAITKDLHAILGLEGIDKWDFKSTRQLLAYIRDQVFPTIDSPLSSEGLDLIHHQAAGLDAIDCLCSRPSSK
jgi:hypothetical protein